MQEDNRLYSCSFETKAVEIFGQQYERYVRSRARAYGIRGFIQPLSETLYYGRLEGTREVLEKIKDVICQSEHFQEELQDVSFSNIRRLRTYTYDSFYIRERSDGQTLPETLREFWDKGKVHLLNAYCVAQRIADQTKANLQYAWENAPAYKNAAVCKLNYFQVTASDYFGQFSSSLSQFCGISHQRRRRRQTRDSF